jgi:hypothetical protein
MIATILANFRTTIEAIMPDTLPGNPFKFLDADLSDAPQTGASDRRFFVSLDDTVELLGDLSSNGRVRFKKTAIVTIQYRVGKSFAAFIARLHEDVDRLAFTLSRPSSYCNGTDYALLSRIPDVNLMVDFDEATMAAVVNVPFTIIYSIDYT